MVFITGIHKYGQIHKSNSFQSRSQSLNFSFITLKEKLNFPGSLCKIDTLIGTHLQSKDLRTGSVRTHLSGFLVLRSHLRSHKRELDSRKNI